MQWRSQDTKVAQVWLVRLVSMLGHGEELRVRIVPNCIFHTLSAVSLSSLVDKGATRSVMSKFDISIMILFTVHNVSCQDRTSAGVTHDLDTIAQGPNPT